MSEIVALVCVDSDGQGSELEFEIPTNHPLILKLRRPARNVEEFLGNDLFSCLLRARGFLEEEGLLVCCQGARPNVFPSGMLRQMGNARFAYVLENDESGAQSKEVDIFAPADASEVGTIAEQKSTVMRYFGFSDRTS